MASSTRTVRRWSSSRTSSSTASASTTCCPSTAACTSPTSPTGKIIGLSKIPRIVDVFARRLQVQERMTQQIAQAIQDVLQPKGVGVVADGRHLCMMMRGVQKQNSSALTSCLLGCFQDSKTRAEFLGLVRGLTT